MSETKKIIFDESLYPLEAIYGACYVFIDRAYIFLDKEQEGKISVQFKAKAGLASGELEVIAGEFANELLAYTLRVAVAKHTKKIREMVIEKALYSSTLEP